MSWGRDGRNDHTCTTVSVRLTDDELSRLDSLRGLRGMFGVEARGTVLRRLVREAADRKTDVAADRKTAIAVKRRPSGGGSR